MPQVFSKAVTTWVGQTLCIICGLSIGGVLAGSSVPHLKNVAFVSAVLVGAIYVFVLPLLNDSEN